MEHERKCTVCGAPFAAKRADARYCSARCRQQALRDRRRPKYAKEWTAPVEKPAPEPPESAVEAVRLAHRAANDLGRLASRGPYQLRAKLGRISAAIQRALDEEGL